MTTDHVLTICPSCGAENRIPLDRIGQQGRCGRCKTPLPERGFHAAAPLAVSEGQFEKLIRVSGLPVLVDFWAEWCAPCRQLAPILERLASDLSGRILVLEVDTERAPMLAGRYQVQAIPTLVLLRSGIEVERMTGLMPIEALKARVEQFL